MKVEQFEDKALAHYSYVILSEGLVVLIDPARDPRPYYDFARDNEAVIIGVIETHPHADFVSSHLEIHKKTGAKLYASRLLVASYPHLTFDEGNEITLGKVKLRALNTPGHSPDSICIVLREGDKDKIVFTGDTLFIGDCGRPDLRENVGAITEKRVELARQMYHSLRDKLMPLDDDVWVYPAHGSGSLCGKALSDANRSTIAAEKISNWSLKEMTEQEFITELNSDQPFVPKYFGFDVELNKNGANDLKPSIARVNIQKVGTADEAKELDPGIIIMDTRPSALYKERHLPNSINLMAGGKFETWLGSIINPGEAFYLAAENKEALLELVLRSSKIGYESFIKAGLVLNYGTLSSEKIELNKFRANQDDYTIVDIRNRSEVKEHPIFACSINIPLSELRERAREIPIKKPLVVHCAGGYRSAAGSSIIRELMPEIAHVYDLSDAIKEFE